MTNFFPRSLSKKSDASFVDSFGLSTQSTTTAQQMAYTDCLVIELIDPDLREDALRVISKVLAIYLLFFCPFLMYFIRFTINQNHIAGCEMYYRDLNCVLLCEHRFI
jgi:hypothetical protein